LPTSTLPPAAPIPPTAVAPRLSIVVLPFTNLSDDRQQQYFADGITEDLTTDLSRLTGMIVISCNTAFMYRNKPVDTRQVGRELGVRYLLEGSVRRSANRVRVNAQLIDAETEAHLWAERFDRDTADLFSLQDEITSRIAVALNLELIGADRAEAAVARQFRGGNWVIRKSTGAQSRVGGGNELIGRCSGRTRARRDE
jgi:TolB-like protein